MSYNPNNPNGQATMANSAPVVIASDQSSIPMVGNAAAAAADSGNPVKVGAKFNTAAPTYSNGQRGDLQIDAGGNLRITGAFASPSADNVSQSGIVHYTNSHTLIHNGSNWDRVRTANSGNGTTGVGVASAGILGFDGTNYRRLVTNTTGQLVTPAATTTGGATTFTLISAATTNATSVKASAGTLYMLAATNNSATVAFLKLYNLATAPTVGTSTPVLTFMLPANGGITVPIPPTGLAFATGISYALTGAATTADTTAVALSQIQLNGAYA